MPGLDGYGIRARLADARLYLCTDARTERGDLADFADSALSGGVDIIQLRDKSAEGAPLEARRELAALEVLAEACVRHGALLAVNDRADVALAAEADVLHLGQEDIPVGLARRIVGDEVRMPNEDEDEAGAEGQADAAPQAYAGSSESTESGWISSGKGAPGLYMALTTIPATWLVMTLLVTR